MSLSAAILIPAYNSSDYIEATLDSIQRQLTGYAQVTGVYLADDCSTDDTCELARQTWRSSVPLYILLSKRNLGQWKNVNRGFSQIHASADWVLILHADDLVKAHWLEALLWRMQKSADSVGSICSSFDVLCQMLPSCRARMTAIEN
jgi:glycosyltransferase involved in cell wall biosynthesis